MPGIDVSLQTDSRTRFNAVFPVLLEELRDYFVQSGVPDDAWDSFRRCLESNVPGGKLNRGLAVMDTARILREAPLSNEEYFRAAVLGWCIEMMQAAFLIADDIMDSSVTRRGRPCWYRVKGIGMRAINDTFLVEQAIYYLLKKHFRGENYYADLFELFEEVTFQSLMGEQLDLITAPEDKVELSKFSTSKYWLIVAYKTAFYSFYLPVALAMRFIGIASEQSYTVARSILIPLGEYFQVQDDYLDCYGAPEIIGKIGTDILVNKCSWNINTALASCTPEQRRVLEENYGRNSVECEARVKDVFNAVDIPGQYAKYEEEACEKINALIDTLSEERSDGSGGLKTEIFQAFLRLFIATFKLSFPT